MNTDLLPLEVYDCPWLYEKKREAPQPSVNVGKWMLFYDKQHMNTIWTIAKKLYIENKLTGVMSMKCSTNYTSSRVKNNGIMLYCSDSLNEDNIMDIGIKIIELFNYKESPNIYYKTDLQLYNGINHAYKLANPLYNT